MYKIIVTLIMLFSFSSLAQIPDIVALVNDKPITKHDFESRKKMAIVFSNIDNSDPTIDRKLNSDILNILIMEELLEQHSEKVGGSISEEEINNAIATIEQRNNMQKGQLLVYIIEKGMDVSTFKKQLHGELIKNHIVTSLSNSVAVSPNEIDVAIINSGAKDFNTEAWVFTSNNTEDIIFKKMQNLKKHLPHCNKVSDKLYKEFAIAKNINNKLSEIDSTTRSVILDTKVGASSNIYKEPGGSFKLVLVCKKEALVSGDELNKVESFILYKKMTQKAEKFFKDLRAKAYIKVMIE